MDTSTKSWHEFRNSEQQHRSYAAVIKVLSAKMVPMTGREICDAAGQEGLWKRLSEMEKVGWVVRVGKRECTVTGKTSNIWRLKTAEEVAAEPAYEGQPIELPGLRELEKRVKRKITRTDYAGPKTILDEAVS
jgi:hypothetical protein